VTLSKCPNCSARSASGTLCVIAAGDEYSYLAPGRQGILGGGIAAGRLDRSLRLLNETTLAGVLVRTANVLIPSQAMARMRAATLAAFAQASDPTSCSTTMHSTAIWRICCSQLRGALTSNSAPRATQLASRNHWRCVRSVRNYIEAHLEVRLRRAIATEVFFAEFG
jgi:hypothetical protein